MGERCKMTLFICLLVAWYLIGLVGWVLIITTYEDFTAGHAWIIFAAVLGIIPIIITVIDRYNDVVIFKRRN